jgi:hypothetical protein
LSTGPKARPNTTPRGGARKGAGRKPTFGISEIELKGLFKALKKQAKERGENWQENFAKRLFSDDWRESAAFHRMLTDQIKVNKQEKRVEITENKGPAIFLPEERPDPSKVVPIKAVS